MKIDRSMMFEWQGHIQEDSDVPHYVEILEVIDLWARTFKTVVCKSPKFHSQPVPKNSMPIRMTYTANVDTVCKSCSVGKHPLYVCKNLNLCPLSNAWIWWGNTSFVSIACYPIILRHSVLLITSVKNVVSHTIHCCTCSSNVMALLKQLIERWRSRC